MGATNPMVALAATAASMALPPFARMVAPICEASGCSVATIPYREMTMDRAWERSSVAAAEIELGKTASRRKTTSQKNGFIVWQNHDRVETIVEFCEREK